MNCILIAHIPWVFFLFLMVLLILILVKSKYSLKNALSENGVESSSRLLSFLSGLSAIVFAYWIAVVYMLYNKEDMPEIDSLVNALLALGIGVVPYAANRVSGIFGRNSSTSPFDDSPSPGSTSKNKVENQKS